MDGRTQVIEGCISDSSKAKGLKKRDQKQFLFSKRYFCFGFCLGQLDFDTTFYEIWLKLKQLLFLERESVLVMGLTKYSKTPLK